MWTCQNCSHAGHCAAMGRQGWPPTNVPRSPRIPALGEGKRREMTASITILWFLSQVTLSGMLRPTPAPPRPGSQHHRESRGIAGFPAEKQCLGGFSQEHPHVGKRSRRQCRYGHPVGTETQGMQTLSPEAHGLPERKDASAE